MQIVKEISMGVMAVIMLGLLGWIVKALVNDISHKLDGLGAKFEKIIELLNRKL